jgi:antitoxin HigA-1
MPGASSSSSTVEGHAMEYRAVRSPDGCPAHPGEPAEVVIPATGRSKSGIAALLGTSRQHLYDVLRERKPVTPNVAVRLGKLFGHGPVWARMHVAHDTRHAAREVDTSRIPTLDAPSSLADRRGFTCLGVARSGRGRVQIFRTLVRAAQPRWMFWDNGHRLERWPVSAH